MAMTQYRVKCPNLNLAKNDNNLKRSFTQHSDLCDAFNVVVKARKVIDLIVTFAFNSFLIFINVKNCSLSPS